MSKRLLYAILMLLVGLGGSAFAQSWPNRTVRVIVPFSAGGAVDVIARTVLDQVSKQLGQSFVIENRVGAGGAAGAAVVAKADPDGYTILVHSSSHTVLPALVSKLSYDATKDFSAVIPLANQPTALFVSSARGYKTIKDFVADPKAKAGSMFYGSGGVGNATHLNAERFLLSAGFRATHVPYKGSPEALLDVLTERVDFSFSALLPALSFLQDGKLRALAVSSQRRASALPDVPTTVEAGFANSDYNFWIGILVPKGVPMSVVDVLHREATKAIAMPGVQEKLRIMGADPMPMTSAEFDKLIADEIATNKELVKAAGIQVN